VDDAVPKSVLLTEDKSLKRVEVIGRVEIGDNGALAQLRRRVGLCGWRWSQRVKCAEVVKRRRLCTGRRGYRPV
jgi:hypothetical protein